MKSSSSNRFAVIGNPVAHSQSPHIHQSFAQQFSVNLSYKKILTDEAQLKKVVDQFFADGGKGLNVTTPFKSAAAALADSCSEVAKASNSVNTLYLDPDTGLLVGDSTDGRGWLTDIHRLKIALEGSNVLIIGAGGAARVLVSQLLCEPVARLHVCNRTKQRAEELVDSKVTASGLDDIPENNWNLIINTLSVGWQGQYPSIMACVNKETCAYDLNYGKGAVAFKKWFIQSGGQVGLFNDGWGMLVEQAAASFNIWWNKKPDTKELISSGCL
ncbi:MAG: shikimate dehydrogenase [Gammaproteobacteria bacterium]|nr:MAG: shikimate dehydrogenase [Gammaproteobacteria bacterium]